MVEKKTSVRSQDPGQRRVLDRAARQRRINRQLEALENDNFQDDPHAGLPQLGKRLPQFDDDADTGKKKKKTRGDHFKLRFRKNFQALLEEQASPERKAFRVSPGLGEGITERKGAPPGPREEPNRARVLSSREDQPYFQGLWQGSGPSAQSAVVIKATSQKL
ncbi:zinc finger HIT domain-containing protein 1 isoform X2 [Kogia breviceps]|uniref:zinc finger HIT domain-containing protein 1 isoform X2 n=1 Tax=Kogia breviceps TaxID=27615 RepID=UPI0034D2CEE9